MYKPMMLLGVLVITLGSGWAASSAEDQVGYGLGRPATDQEV